jgi:hypothetical protein
LEKGNQPVKRASKKIKKKEIKKTPSRHHPTENKGGVMIVMSAMKKGCKHSLTAIETLILKKLLLKEFCVYATK